VQTLLFVALAGFINTLIFNAKLSLLQSCFFRFWNLTRNAATSDGLHSLTDANLIKAIHFIDYSCLPTIKPLDTTCCESQWKTCATNHIIRQIFFTVIIHIYFELHFSASTIEIPIEHPESW
jgi:hypothetical protein